MSAELASNGVSAARPAKGQRSLPHNLDAEASILGGIIVKPSVLAMLRTLETDDFYLPQHKVVFEAIRNLDAAGKPIDEVTIDAEIERRGKSDATGGIGFLGALALRVPTIDNVLAYTKIVRDLAMMRRLALSASRIADRAYNWEFDPTEYLEESIGEIQRIGTDFREGEEKVPLIDVGFALEQLAVLARTPIYTTPFPALNAALGFGGVLGGQAYTIVSGTGAGKTSFVSTVGEHHAANQGDTLIATWEMLSGYFVARMAAKHLKVHSNQILRGEMNWGAVQDSIPNRISFLERPSLAMLRRAIIQITDRSPTKQPPLVIVDYIQALAEDVAATIKNPDPRQVNALVSRELIKIARDTGAPMLVVSATARQTAAKLVIDVRKQPPRDLVGAAKETSQIEYDCAGLIVLSLSDEEDLDGQIATMTIAKARFGEVCHIDARYDGRRGAWLEIGRVQKVTKATPGTQDTNLAVIRDAVLAALRKQGPATSKNVLVKWTNKSRAAVLSEVDAMLADGTLEFKGARIVAAGSDLPSTPKRGALAAQIAMAEADSIGGSKVVPAAETTAEIEVVP